MRVAVLFVTLLMAAGGLAGCIGGEKEDPVDPNALPGTDPGPGSDPGSAPIVTVLNPLKATLAFEGAEWVETGSKVPFSVSVPAMAKGDVTYTWAIGALPGTVEVMDMKADTGSAKVADYIAPGAAKPLKFDMAGVYRMHCHPHPNMRHNVTVVDGIEPTTVHVQIIDGATQNEYRYVPEEVLVGVGSTVYYHNNGTQPHTSTALAQEPPPKQLPIEGNAGEVTVDGDGWQRVVVVMQDAEGRIGSAEAAIYTSAELPTFDDKLDFAFDVGADTSALPAEAPVPVVETATKPFTFEHNGTLFMNWTSTDAASATGEDTVKLEIHLTEEGATQDTLTGPGDAAGSLSGRVQGKTYTLSVTATQGVMVEGTVTIEVLYDLVPPAPTMKAAPADDGHGGHAH